MQQNIRGRFMGIGAAVLVLGILAAPCYAMLTFTPAATETHIASDAPNQTGIYLRQLGSEFNTLDDTIPVTFTSIYGDHLTSNSSTWSIVDLTQYGVPVDAKAAILTAKGVITKGTLDADAVIYLFVKRPSSTCCQGPPGFEQYPIDYQWTMAGAVQPIVQTVAHLPHDDRRDYPGAYAPIENGKIAVAWGYRRLNAPPWPVGDAMGVTLLLNGWIR